MVRSLLRVSRFAGAALLALGLAALGPGRPLAGDSDRWDPAMSTSDTMEHHHAESEDPDSLLAESENPDDKLGHSKDPDDLVVESEDPDEMVAESESVDSRQGHSEKLQDLSNAKPDAGDREVVPASQADWGPTNDPRVLVARDKVVRAEKRATRARTHYGDMMARDYPRGAARERIVKERDESMQALEEAQGALQALEDSP